MIAGIAESEKKIMDCRKFSLERCGKMKTAQVSYCKKEIMSICTAGSGNRQKECSFYEKSCQAEKCMYFVFDEYCDSLKAQMHAQVTPHSAAYCGQSINPATAHWL
jgi:hypothetical protein